jgi:GTP 3',8-cyclase
MEENRYIFERTNLSQAIPLDTPIVVFIEVSRSCNFKCKYCYHSFSPSKARELNIVNNGSMAYELFTRIVDGMKEFPNKVKCVHLSNRGESLLNKRLPEMISYLKQSNTVERINLVTNGSLLSPNLNRKLIDAGLDSMKISVQSVTEDGYKDIAGVKISMSHFVENIKHLYLIRRGCKVLIKIADLSLKNDSEKQKFYEMFSGICDGISIEHIFDLDDHLSLSINKEKAEKDISVYNKQLKRIKVCPMPFYVMNIGFDGRVIPCCYYKMETFADLLVTSPLEFWTGERLRRFRHSILRDKENEGRHALCGTCNIPIYITEKEDNIDDCAQELEKYFE